jgi:hypothetical protein
MDELIRELERELQMARAAADAIGQTTPSGLVMAGEQVAFERAIALAQRAKRRIAEREPAWDVQP